jgi:sortase A
MQLFLRWSRYFFFAIGILALVYVGYSVIDARLFLASETRQFQQELDAATPSVAVGDRPGPSSSPAAITEAKDSSAERVRPPNGGSPSGRLEIRSIGLVAMIMEGTDERTLRHAIGHVKGTSMPGEDGNVAIAGHRDTFFRDLRHIQRNDEITLTTLTGEYHYSVDVMEVVGPEDTAVLQNSGQATLTLVTCYPFYLVGPAPKRFVVRAHSSDAR